MSREDPIIVQINRPNQRAMKGTEAKRKIRDADIVISSDNMVVKDRYGPGLGQRAATATEKRKAEQVTSEF